MPIFGSTNVGRVFWTPFQLSTTYVNYGNLWSLEVQM